MRLLSMVVLAGLCALTARAEDWTTTDGKTYKDVKVLKHDALTVTILDGDGGASVPLEKLPAGLQQRFEYDPAKAKAESAALERSALKKKGDAVSKSAATLIGTIVDSRSEGYFVAVYPEGPAPRSTRYSGSHNRFGAVADRGWHRPANAIGVGIWFLKTQNTYQRGQKLGLIVYPCGTISDPPYRPIMAFTNDLDTAGGKASAKLPTLQPPVPKKVVTKPPLKTDQFNPGSINDNVLNNSATMPPLKTDQFNPGSMGDDVLQ
jgi:hypothetical protein